MTMKQKAKNFFSSIKQYILNLRTNQLFLICCFLSVIYLISGYWKWLEFGVSICAIAFMFYLPLDKALCLFMFMHSFTKSNLFYDSCFMMTVVGFTIMLLLKYIIGLKNKKYKFNKRITICIGCFYLFGLFFSLFKPWFYNTLIYLTYLPMFYFIFEMRSEFNINSGIKYMFAGLITSCCLGLLTIVLPHYQYCPFYAGRFSALYNNPNHIYMRAIFILSYFSYRFIKNNLSSLKYCLIYITCAIISISGISKTGIFMLALMTLIFIILYLKGNFKKRIKYVLILLTIIFVVSIICYPLILKVFNRFLYAFASNNFWNSLLTNRDIIWNSYLNKIFDSPLIALFGNGMFTEQVFVPNEGTIETHNLYIWLLYRFGIIGTIALGYIIYLFIKDINLEKPKFIAYLPLIFLLLESFCDNTMKCYNITYFIFAFMILFMDSKEKTTERQSKQIKEQEKIKE